MVRILRVKKDTNFTTIDNRYVRDKRLSWQAKGLLVYILTLPDDWKIYPDELRKHAKTGLSGTRSALSELRKYGYLELCKIIDEKTKRVVSWEYMIHEMPIFERKDSDFQLQSKAKPELEKPHVEKPQVDQPHVEKRTLLNTNINEILIKQNTECNIIPSIIQEKTQCNIVTSDSVTVTDSIHDKSNSKNKNKSNITKEQREEFDNIFLKELNIKQEEVKGDYYQAKESCIKKVIEQGYTFNDLISVLPIFIQKNKSNINLYYLPSNMFSLMQSKKQVPRIGGVKEDNPF